MSSTSETGHAKNVANFKDLITLCESFGSEYNPARDELKIPELQTLLASSEASLQSVNSLLPAFNTAVAVKNKAFNPLQKLSTRLLAAFAASGTHKGEINSVATLAKKLKGEKKYLPKTNNPILPGSIGGATVQEKPPISQSQMSMDMQVENFNKMIEVLAANKNYKPNENELKVATLKTMATQLKTLSEAVVLAEGPVLAARSSRNKVLYDHDKGMLAIAADVKKYIKSIYGARSPQYKRLTAMRFTAVS